VTFLPVVARELRVTARLPGTHWTRTIVALVALAIGGWIMLLPYATSAPGVLGKALFGSMSVLANIYALLLGLLRTSDCISEEKREGTLGLLFLTDLKAYDVVLGKLAATSLNSFYGMLAIFPILGISLLVGGVTGSEFGRMVLVSVNNLLFSLALGIFCSAISRDERKALALALFTMILVTALFPFFASLSGNAGNGFSWNPIFLCLSPSACVYMAFAKSPSYTGQDYFYASLITIHVLTWILLGIACFIVPRTWHDKVQSSIGRSGAGFWRELAFGSARSRGMKRLRLLDENAFFWLTSRDRLKAILVWCFLGLIALFWIWGLTWDPSGWKTNIAYLWTAFIAHTVLKFWLTAEACRQFCQDCRSGALELVLSTPLTVSEIVTGQAMSLRRQFLFPASLVVFADLVFLSSETDSEWTLTWIAGTSMFVADLVALSWLSMWLGLNSRSAARATAATLVRILVLPWLAFLALLTAMALSSVFLSRVMPQGFEGKMLIGAWMLFGFLNNALFGFWAARKLQSEFRLVATTRFETVKGYSSGEAREAAVKTPTKPGVAGVQEKTSSPAAGSFPQ